MRGRLGARHVAVRIEAHDSAPAGSPDGANAADTIFTLRSPEVYLLLTVERGWSPARWQRWLTDAIAQAVLR